MWQLQTVHGAQIWKCVANQEAQVAGQQGAPITQELHAPAVLVAKNVHCIMENVLGTLLWIFAV